MKRLPPLSLIDLTDREPLEIEEQMVVVQYCELNNLKFTAIPNSTYTKSQKQKAKNHREGLRAGFPDMVVITRSGLLCIEMKRRKTYNKSKAQKEWVAALQNTPGVEARFCRGADEAIAFIAEFAGTPLSDETTPFWYNEVMTDERKYKVRKSNIVKQNGTYAWVKLDGKKVPVFAEEGESLTRAEVRKAQKPQPVPEVQEEPENTEPQSE